MLALCGLLASAKLFSVAVAEARSGADAVPKVYLGFPTPYRVVDIGFVVLGTGGDSPPALTSSLRHLLKEHLEGLGADAFMFDSREARDTNTNGWRQVLFDVFPLVWYQAQAMPIRLAAGEPAPRGYLKAVRFVDHEPLAANVRELGGNFEELRRLHTLQQQIDWLDTLLLGEPGLDGRTYTRVRAALVDAADWNGQVNRVDNHY